MEGPGTLIELLAYAKDSHEYHTKANGLEGRNTRMDIVKATHLNAIIPAQLAAQSLVFFYRALWLKTTEEWIHEEPHDVLTISMGNLLINMMSTSPIQWDFVARFATKMLGATAQGFTGTYDIQYSDKLANTAVIVSLRVIDHITGLEVREDSNISLHRQMRQSSSLQAYRSLGKRGSLSTPSRKVSKMPRANLLKSSLILQNFRSTYLITPVIIASRYLQDFYDLIALKIETGLYNDIAPMHSFVFSRWNYKLTFFCYAAPVPWEFVQEVAIEMSDYAAKGFTPAFEAVYRAVDELGKEIFVSISFQLLKNVEPIQGTEGIIHT